jgi:predicted MPP superfamily phosphohydrolase
MDGDDIRAAIRQEQQQAGSAGIIALKPVKERRGPFLQVRVPHGFEWNRYELEIDGLKPELDGFRILHLSDLHFNPRWSRVYEQVLQRVEAARADLVLVTGDFVDSKTKGPAAVPYVMRFLEGLKARLGVYGIAGNHDGDLLVPYLPKSGIRMVDGRRTIVGGGVELIGTTEVAREDFDWGMMREMGSKPAGGVRVVLSHFPDTLKRLAEFRPDIVLAGHTHGGQICLPGGVPIIWHDSLPKRMCKGVHRVGRTWLCVSRGLGFTGLPFRVWCPAEVIELVLRPAAPRP